MGKQQPDESIPQGIEPGRPYRLVDLVQTALGSIVSRTLVDRDEGTLTLFAFDKGQGLSEHTTPFDAYALVLEGEAEFTVGAQAVEADTGQVVLLPADVPHSVRALQPFKMLLAMVRAAPS